jgi:hypothetical protein
VLPRRVRPTRRRCKSSVRCLDSCNRTPAAAGSCGTAAAAGCFHGCITRARGCYATTPQCAVCARRNSTAAVATSASFAPADTAVTRVSTSATSGTRTGRSRSNGGSTGEAPRRCRARPGAHGLGLTALRTPWGTAIGHAGALLGTVSAAWSSPDGRPPPCSRDEHSLPLCRRPDRAEAAAGRIFLCSLGLARCG